LYSRKLPALRFENEDLQQIEREEIWRTRHKARGLGSLQDDEALALKLLGAA
jgi:hypothetical protein